MFTPPISNFYVNETIKDETDVGGHKNYKMLEFRSNYSLKLSEN